MGIFSRKASRTVTIKKSSAAPLLPEAMEKFLARRLRDARGLLLAGLSLFLFLSLLTFDIRDPSFNTAAAEVSAIHNWLGRAGAYTADTLLQTLGITAYLLAATAGVWAGRLLTGRSLPHPGGALSLLFVSALAASALLARLPSFESWGPGAYLGGSAGALIYTGAGNLFQGWLGGMTFLFVGACSFLIFAVCYPLSLGLSLEEWSGVFTRVQAAVNTLRERMERLNARLRVWQERHAPEASVPQRRTLAVQLDRDVTQESPAEDQERQAPPEKVKPLVQPRAGKLKSGKKEEKQKKLNLWSSEEGFQLPSLDLLQTRTSAATVRLDETALQKNAELLQATLRDFGVEGEITRVSPGPIVTLYELEPAPGTKSSRVIGLSDDIARSMSAVSVRIAVVPGRNVIGIELPNARREMVILKEMLSSADYEKVTARLPLALGKNIAGDAVIADLARMPHLLVAGTTGSGKSVAVNTMILSLLYRLSPEQCRFIMIDPKMLELSVYDDIPHLLTPVVTEPRRAITALKWAVREMEDRYRAMSKLGVRNIDGFNERIRDARSRGEVLMHKVQTGFDADTGRPVYEEQPVTQNEMPYIVIIVDEFADLMLVAGKDVESSIQRLAQMARAAGIHLIMATQRPSVDVVTGVIKANFPTRISFQVTSKIDSRTILGEGGAEQLLGQGDMLYMAAGGRVTRVHGPFVGDDEVEKVVKYLRAQGVPHYIDGVTEETEGDGEGDFGVMDSGGGGEDGDLYRQAVQLVLRERKASTSFIQRYLQIGYNRAARLIERMEKEGLISAPNHVGKREILSGEENYGT